MVLFNFVVKIVFNIVGNVIIFGWKLNKLRLNIIGYNK